MLNLTLPDATDLPAAVFDQTGTLIATGSREACETLAEQQRGLYCWIVNGKPVIRRDFEEQS